VPDDSAESRDPLSATGVTSPALGCFGRQQAHQASRHRFAGVSIVLGLTLATGCASTDRGTVVLSQGCVKTDGCTLTPFDDPANAALRAQLSCEPMSLYRAVHPGALCPDTGDNRRILHDHHLTGYVAGYCDACLTVPDGKIFVLFVLAHPPPPNCPSTCAPAPTVF
jgi:hypothetical protein